MYATVDGARLFFDVEGPSLMPDGPAMRERPTLVCLHGGPGLDHSSFRPGLSALAEVAQVVYLDQRGHGRSDRGGPDEWRLERWADDVRGFCEALGIVRPVVLGISFGGAVAMAYATRHPDHPAALVLVSTSARGTANPVRREGVLRAFERRGGPAAREAVRRAFDERTPEALAEYLRVCGPLYNHRPADPDAVRRTVPSPAVLPHFERAGGEGIVFDLLPGLAGVRCPALVVSGEDDPITPPAEQEAIVAALPPGVGRLARFAGCGHGILRDDAAKLVQVVAEFLAKAVRPVDLPELASDDESP